MKISLDFTHFDAAMRDYKTMSRRSIAYIINKGIKDAAFRAAGYIQLASKKDLASWRDLSKRDPSGVISPFVAYLIGKAIKRGTFQSSSEQRQDLMTMRASGSITGKQFKKSFRKTSKHGRYTRADAKLFGKTVFGSRYRRVSFLKSILANLAKRIRAETGIGGGSAPGTKDISRQSVIFRKALETSSNPEASFSAAYPYKKQKRGGDVATRLLYAAMQKGLNDKAVDMRMEFEKRIAEAAAKISAKSSGGSYTGP